MTARPFVDQGLKGPAIREAVAARLERLAKGAGRGSFWDELVELALAAGGVDQRPNPIFVDRVRRFTPDFERRPDDDCRRAGPLQRTHVVERGDAAAGEHDVLGFHIAVDFVNGIHKSLDFIDCSRNKYRLEVVTVTNPVADSGTDSINVFENRRNLCSENVF